MAFLSSYWAVCAPEDSWKLNPWCVAAGFCTTRKSNSLIFARKKASGFGELLLQRRQGDKASPDKKHVKLKPGRVSPTLPVPPHIPKPPYVGSASTPSFSATPQVHNDQGIEKMRAACQLAARVRDYGGTLVKPGVTTDEIDKAVHKMIIDAGAYPSPLGYGGFPKSVCTSVNECICHGIPDSRPLQDGDIINIDVTVYLNGYHGDTSATFCCGSVSEEAKQLVEVTREALNKAIEICRPGAEFKLIGGTINDVADRHGYGVVKRFVGHGIGTVFHCAPSVLHFRNNEPGRMQRGQTFTIEPMLTIGKADEEIWDDNWTAVTVDGSLSAQFEHTLLITQDGAQVLTR